MVSTSTYMVYPGGSEAAGSLTETLLKEDVSDLITNLFPLDTPLQQILSKVPMRSVFTEQPVDTFSGIVRTNDSLIANSGATSIFPKAEGHTYTNATTQYPAKLKSVAEIQGIQFGVSDTDQAMSMYGIADRFAYEALKTTKTVVNNFETSFWWSIGSGPEGKDFDSAGGTYTARQTQGLMPWICTTGLERTTATPATSTDGNGNVFTLNGTLWNAAATTAYDAAGLALDQSMFKDDVMEPWWTLTGRTGGAVGFASPKVKNLFSQFALTANGPVNDRTLDAAAKMVVDTVDYYETDYGVVSINMSRYLSVAGQTTTFVNAAADSAAWNESLVLIHPQYFNIGVVRPVYFSPLGKTGDFEQGLIRGEQALICRNPQGGTAVVNCIP